MALALESAIGIDDIRIVSVPFGTDRAKKQDYLLSKLGLRATKTKRNTCIVISFIRN
jgi:hypothetical protein